MVIVSFRHGTGTVYENVNERSECEDVAVVQGRPVENSHGQSHRWLVNSVLLTLLFRKMLLVRFCAG